MRIFIAISSLTSGGAERVCVRLASLWFAQGHEVHLVTLTGKERDFYELPEGLVRSEFRPKENNGSAFGAIGNNFNRLRAMRSHIIQSNPDVIVSLMTYCNILCLFASTGLNIPVVVAEHNYPPFSAKSRFWQVVRKYSYNRAASVLALNSTCADWLRTNTYAKRVSVIPNAVNWPLPALSPHVPVGQVGPDRKIFLSVGRLNEQKAFDRLISAFEIISAELPEWDLVIIGEGELKDILSAQIERVGLRSRVKMLGRVGNVVDWYERSDVFVLSSNYEGFPGAMLEAMSSGTPVVSVDCLTGPKDLIQHCESGFLCENNASALARGMTTMAQDGSLRKRVSENSKYVLKNYSNSVIEQIWKDEFAALGLDL